ncbi:acyltransferase [Streptomyces sp. NPDC002138]|uniref:acyltransferase family protein n=1 Tax=Streptomyces sp. NPDC002138 TaxID=3154410 RepID=UPI0033213451
MPELRARWAAVAGRIDSATPTGRDRSVDALRAVAICGVVLGHWLITSLNPAEGGLRTSSPLSSMPWLAPLSWVLQTLSVFFLVGGHVGALSYAAARAAGVSYGQWIGRRLGRLFRPVAAVLVLWTVVAGAMLVTGVEFGTVRGLVRLVLSPMWFLLVFACLTALTPLVARLSPLWPLAVVAVVDGWRFALDGPAWIGWVNVPAGWLVPYVLGAAWARGAFTARRAPAVLMLAGGVVATAALVLWGGYPASMVGVPGAAISNLNPPTLAAVTFGLAQCALALLVREPLARVMRKPGAWAGVALVNLSAMTVFLWHQTAMMCVTALGLGSGVELPGLLTAADSASWMAARLLWLPVFGAALLVCRAAFHTYERGGREQGGREQRSRGTSRIVRAGIAPAPVVTRA